jgi:DNA-binding GntR family transcriptional regulator
MRGPSKTDVLNTTPPDLRMSSATTQAYLDIRSKILKGEYKTDTLITPKEIQDEYKVSSSGTQLLLLRLASEGLIKVQRVKHHNWKNNAAVSEYRIADIDIRHRIFSSRQGDFVSDVSRDGVAARKENLELKMQYADEEVAQLLEIQAGDKVIYNRNLQCRGDTVIAISDTYIPYWFAEMMPELEKPDNDIYALMHQLGKNPTWCTETVDIVQASSKERELFELSPDDPTPMIKILRRSYDKDGTPLDVQFLTDRGDMYRLHYSFPLFPTGVPENFRKR